MKISLKKVKNQVMVITGASSGIGLATALAAAKKGAKVVLVSRNRDALEDIVAQIEADGGDAMYAVADVADRDELQHVAEATIAHYGGFDTWVNNAGVSIYGKLSEVSDEDNRRLFETNYWGLVYGSLIAAEHLREKGGAIINLGSVLSDVSIPIQGMYSASKHAVKGFTESLRMELEYEEAPISVTLIKPASINTPYPQHAKNYTGKKLTLPPPVYDPTEVANGILHAAAHQERDVYIGSAAKVMSSTNKFMASLMDEAGEDVFTKLQTRDKPAIARSNALHDHAEGGSIRGEYEGYVRKKSLYTRASNHPVVTGALVLAAGAAALAFMGEKD